VGDVLESMAADVRARIEALGGQMKEIQEGMSAMVERVGSLSTQTVSLDSEQPARSTD